MSADSIASSVSNLSRDRLSHRPTFSLLKLSLFTVAYIIAYGLGSLFPQSSSAPLWLPDSILLCALLVVPRNEWWSYLAIAVPIRFFPGLHPALPFWFLFAAAANDILKAIFAAHLFRRLTNDSIRLATLSELSTFFAVCAFFVPALSALVGAATRQVLGYPFWASSYQWFLGDSLANIALTPALLYWCSGHFRNLRLRSAEFALWIIGFSLSLLLAFQLAHSAYSPIAFCAPVPSLIWAAVRFRPIGASTALSGIALLATASIFERITIFSSDFESKSVLFLQVFLFVVAVPILYVAVLIEERDTAAEKLRGSEERLRLAAQAGRMYAYDWNARTNEVVRSSEFVAVLGLTSPEPLSDEQFVDGIHPDDRERFLHEIGSLTPANPNRDITYRFLSPRGRVIWLRSSGHGLFDEAGKLLRVVGMVTDVTEQKLTENKLREYEKAVEGAEEMIGVVDRQYRFLLANRQYLKMRNMAWDQVVGRSIPDVLGKEVFETVIRPKLDECFRGRVVRYEMRLSYPIVGERDLLLSYFPIEDVNGAIDRAACILHDITDRKRAEDALHDLNRALEGQTAFLRTREELLRNFVKNVPAGVAMLDRDMRYLQVSDMFCADYSLDSSQVLGRSHYELFPDIPDSWKEIHQRALHGETLRADEDRWDREDGTLWIRWEVRPWWNSDGSQGGVLLFAEDITAIKRSEETLSRVNQKLIQAQEEERTRIARELHDDICQRTALLAVKLDDFRNGHPESLSALRRELAQASKEVQDLGSDVQALSHRLHSSKLQLLGLASAAAGFCKEFSAQHGVEIDFRSQHMPEGLPEDISICLFRVLQEAVQNAAKHSGSRHFQVLLRGRSNQIELTIHDSGIGFDLDKALHREGIGLTSMRERMKLINGELSVESESQLGTTVLARVAWAPQMKTVSNVS